MMIPERKNIIMDKHEHDNLKKDNSENEQSEKGQFWERINLKKGNSSQGI